MKKNFFRKRKSGEREELTPLPSRLPTYGVDDNTAVAVAVRQHLWSLFFRGDSLRRIWHSILPKSFLKITQNTDSLISLNIFQARNFMIFPCKQLLAGQESVGSKRGGILCQPSCVCRKNNNNKFTNELSTYTFHRTFFITSVN